jgi:hypothetical protein
MDQNGILSIVAIVVSIGGTVLAVFNHKRCRSHCLGTDLVVSVDVENTTPPKDELKINIPSEPPKINRITYDA